MRNILVTVMMIVVVVLLFKGIIFDGEGVKKQIEEQGTTAIDTISGVTLVP